MKIKFFVFSLSLLLNSYSVAGYAPEQVWDFIKESGGIEGALKVLVEKTAKVLPQKIDSQTEITSVSSILNEVHYNARLITVESNASTLLKKIKPLLKKNSTNYLCSSPVSKVLITEAGAKYFYHYYSKKNEYLFDFVIGKKQCLNR